MPALLRTAAACFVRNPAMRHSSPSPFTDPSSCGTLSEAKCTSQDRPCWNSTLFKAVGLIHLSQAMWSVLGPSCCA